MKLSRFEAIDWDDEEDVDENLAHCLRNDVTEILVDEVLTDQPVEIKMRLETADSKQAEINEWRRTARGQK